VVYSITVRGLCVHEMVVQGNSMWQVRAFRPLFGHTARPLSDHFLTSDHGLTMDRCWTVGADQHITI
jgi:hypothetical protein